MQQPTKPIFMVVFYQKKVQIYVKDQTRLVLWGRKHTSDIIFHTLSMNFPLKNYFLFPPTL